ncbi:MAG: ATP-binding cassette domain-containing protein [Lachnospiraceae bacterium]|nr:ATP-binding cassette domain-containing protein [Lachnospiraceae bacterium]
MEPIIKIANIEKTFNTANGSIKALSNINLDIYEGEIFGIIGLSGAGKSTLVRCINYLEEPTEGDIIFEGRSLAHMTEKERRKTRQSMGMVFQSFNLLEQRNALDNVCFPLEIAGVDRKQALKRANELLERVGLGDRKKSFPSMLSGGQKQRVAIARAIATNPKVLLCDEATSALDPNTTKQILELLKSINNELGITVIVITHEMKVIETICNRVAIIDRSTIAEVGEVKEIFSNPKSKIGKQLIMGGRVNDDEIWSRGGDGRKIRIAFDEETTDLPVVSEMILACGAPVNILHASTKTLGSGKYGQMLVELPPGKEKERECMDYLDSHNIKYEEVNIDDL